MSKNIMFVVDEVKGDVRNLAELLDVLVKQVLDTSKHEADVERLSALSWIARDLADKALADLIKITESDSTDLYQSYVSEQQQQDDLSLLDKIDALRGQLDEIRKEVSA